MYPEPRAVPVPEGIPVQVISVSTEVTHPPAAEAVDLQPLTQETKTFPVRKTQLSFFLMLKLKDKLFLSLKKQSFSSYNARYLHNLYEFADLKGWKGVCPPPPFLEKSSLVKTPQKITENRFWSKRLPNWGVIFLNWRRFPLTNADYIIVILSFRRNKDANIDP